MNAQLVTMVLGFLTLDEVLVSTEQHFPKLLGAQMKVEAAQGENQSAEGIFDLKMKAEGGADPLGYYTRPQADVSIEQLLPLWGTRVKAGYRWGQDLPSYGGKEWTSEFGEARVAIEVPLLRDGAIDQGRLEVAQTSIGLDISNADLKLARLDALYQASRKYWKWVAAGQELHVRERLLKLATQRETAAKQKVGRGSAPRIELIDAERFSVSRREEVQAAQIKLRAAALELSIYFRGPDGTPTVPRHDQLPSRIPASPLHGVTVDLAAVDLALDRRPEMLRYSRELDMLNEQLGFYENQRLPKVDLQVKGSRDIGERQAYGYGPGDVTRNRTELMFTLKGEWPVQQRKARGKAAATSAKINQLKLKQQLAAEQIKAEVETVVYALEISQSRAQMAEKAQSLSLQLEEAERRKLELGQSNILFLLKREEYSADSAVKFIKAAMELRLTIAAYERALALL